MTKKHISYSALAAFQCCPFKYKLLYEDRIKQPGNLFFAFGTAIHAVCEGQLLETKLPEEERKTTSQWKAFFTKVFVKEMKDNLPVYKFSQDDKKFALDLTNQGKALVGYVLPELRKKFGNFELVNAEEKLYEKIEGYDFKFKGFIDLIIKTEDGKHHVLDYKTCVYWDPKKRRDTMTLYQLILYKYFYAQKYNIPMEDVEVHFALLKRTSAIGKNVEIFSITSGPKRTKNALEFMGNALSIIKDKKFFKKKTACDSPYVCPFKGTEHCK